jgi:glucokinase
LALLGIEIGGTKLVLALGDEAGQPQSHLRRPMAPSGSWARDLESIITDARGLLARASSQAPVSLVAIGVSAPGPSDPTTGIVSYPPNLPGWQEVPIARVLGDAFGVPVRLENDANAAALAEWRFGAGRGARDLAYLTMSTGVGGGLILDGRLYRGAFGGAGEFGHIPIVAPGGLDCACGRRGCLEAYCGGNAWSQRLRAQTPASSAVLALSESRDRITPEHLVAAAHAGDAFALEELARWVECLGRGLVQLALTLEPERIVLGTIAVAAGEALCFEPLRRQLDASLWPHQKGRIEVVAAHLGDRMPEFAGLAVAVGSDASEAPSPGAGS